MSYTNPIVKPLYSYANVTITFLNYYFTFNIVWVDSDLVDVKYIHKCFLLNELFFNILFIEYFILSPMCIICMLLYKTKLSKSTPSGIFLELKQLQPL